MPVWVLDCGDHAVSIQRYIADPQSLVKIANKQPQVWDIIVVTEADHISAVAAAVQKAVQKANEAWQIAYDAAVAAAERRVRMETQLECRLTPDDWRDAMEQAREQGQRDALSVIEAARDKMPDTTIRRELDRVIRAIKGDSGSGERRDSPQQ